MKRSATAAEAEALRRNSPACREGGVPIRIEGRCVGGGGVSGAKSSEDARIARAGIAAPG